MKTRPILEVSGLSVRRSGHWLLKDIDWTVRRGEHWVIVGPNGCGKTTLLRCLAGYTAPTEGDIAVLGETYGESDWRALRRRIGLVSSSVKEMIPGEEPALETVVTGRHAMIDLWGKVSDADARAALATLRRIECAHLKDRPWMYLSQGERQRVMIGRALMAKPALMILDEPCAGLDPVAREHFLQFLDRWTRRKNGPAVVLVTHHVEEIIPAFTHALALREGRRESSGRHERVINDAVLSRTFGCRVSVSRKQGRFFLSVAESRRTL